MVIVSVLALDNYVWGFLIGLPIIKSPGSPLEAPWKPIGTPLEAPWKPPGSHMKASGSTLEAPFEAPLKHPGSPLEVVW